MKNPDRAMFLVSALILTFTVVSLTLNAGSGIKSGIITNKHASPVETATDFASPGFTPPNQWWVVVSDEGRTERVVLSEGRWNTVRVGDRMCLHDCSRP